MTGFVAAPRFRTMRWPPSRRSTVFKSFAAINATSCCSRPTSIGPRASPGAAASFNFFFADFFSLNVASFEGLIQRREHLAPGVRDEHIILDAHAPFARQIDARLDGDDHARPQFFISGVFVHGRKLVDLAS